MGEPQYSPEQVAILRTMEGIHRFASECLVLFGDDSLVGLAARRVAQRAYLQLIVGVDPDLEEIRGIVAASLDARRERLAALAAK